MADPNAHQPPDLTRSNDQRLALVGDWTLIAQRMLESKGQQIVELGAQMHALKLDLSGVTRLDTAGAWLINRARRQLGEAGVSVELIQVRPEYLKLLGETD